MVRAALTAQGQALRVSRTRLFSSFMRDRDSFLEGVSVKHETLFTHFTPSLDRL